MLFITQLLGYYHVTRMFKSVYNALTQYKMEFLRNNRWLNPKPIDYAKSKIMGYFI